MMAVVTLGELSRAHPVLSILRVEQQLEHNEQLKAYVTFLICSHQPVPATMNELYGGYVNYIMKRNTWTDNTTTQHNSITNSKDLQPPQVTTDAAQVFIKYGQAAFDMIVRKRKLTREVLEKQYQIVLPPPTADTSGASSENDSCYNDNSGNAVDARSVRGTYGFLVPDHDTSTTNKNKGAPLMKFRDAVIRDYLAAHYQLSEVTRKIRTNRKKLLSSNLIESVRRLPGTGDLWRITIGLMVKSGETRKKQRPLMVELLDYSKTLITMSSYDMTSLCIESVYESRLASSISRKALDDFTLNQTINFSNVRVAPHRLHYSIAAVGHLVRTNGEVFGLHMANFGINETNIHLLADPLNVISDNSLQVLNLSGNELGEAGVLRLERFFVKASLLTHLELSGCLLFDAGAIAVSEVLICLQLIYLNLSNNGITDKGMGHVLRKLPRYCPALEFLHVAGNRLTDKSTVVLADIINDLPRLRSLDLRRNQIGEEGVKMVSANSKNLKPMLETERKKSTSTGASISTVWKTRSARLANFSLRKVPMAGVMKRSNTQAPAANTSDENTAACDGTMRLPDLIEEHSDEDEGDEQFQNVKTDESQEPPPRPNNSKRENKRLKIRSMQRLKQIDRVQLKRKNSAPPTLV